MHPPSNRCPMRSPISKSWLFACAHTVSGETVFSCNSENNILVKNERNLTALTRPGPNPEEVLQEKEVRVLRGHVPTLCVQEKKNNSPKTGKENATRLLPSSPASASATPDSSFMESFLKGMEGRLGNKIEQIGANTGAIDKLAGHMAKRKEISKKAWGPAC